MRKTKAPQQPLPISQLARMEQGSYAVYEFDTPEERLRVMRNTVTSAAINTGAKLTQAMLDAFDSEHRPRYLLRVSVLKQGRPLGKRGPKTNKGEAK